MRTRKGALNLYFISGLFIPSCTKKLQKRNQKLCRYQVYKINKISLVAYSENVDKEKQSEEADGRVSGQKAAAAAGRVC
jgi:hypothetical protein